MIILTDYIGSSRKSCSNRYRFTDLVSWNDWRRRCGSDGLIRHVGGSSSSGWAIPSDEDLSRIAVGDGG